MRVSTYAHDTNNKGIYVINKATCMVSTPTVLKYMATRYLYCIPITDVRYMFAYCSIFDDLFVLVINT